VDLSMSVLGWFHTPACLVAIAAAAWLLVTRKGTRRHRRLGNVFTVSVLFACVTSLGIYSRHAWTAAHWFAIFGIVTTGGGWLVAHFKQPRLGWRYLHLTLMLLSVYNLIAGGVNEVYLRINVLRHFWRDGFHVIGMTHGVVMLVFLVLILAFLIATAVGSRLRRRVTRPA
jgi:hypothetical protein